MYEPPPPIKRKGYLSCPVCGERAATYAERMWWQPWERRSCAACGAPVRPSYLTWVIPLVAGVSAAMIGIALDYPRLVMYVIAGTLAVIGVALFDRLRPG